MIFERVGIFGLTLCFAERARNLERRRIGAFAQNDYEQKVEIRSGDGGCISRASSGWAVMTAQPYQGSKVLFHTGRPHDPVVTDVEYIKPGVTSAKTEVFFSQRNVSRRCKPTRRDEKDRPATPVFLR